MNHTTLDWDAILKIADEYVEAQEAKGTFPPRPSKSRKESAL